MQLDLVSVIMPAFNAERYIKQSIDSVLNQTYPYWELFVVDDGSTDNTANIVRSFKYDRITYIYQNNTGPMGARNTGIRRARGEFMSFLDSDDIWFPQFLERCIQEMSAVESKEIVGVYTTHENINEEAILLPKPGNPIIKPELLPAKLVERNFFPPCVVLIKSQTIREIGMFDESLPGMGTEDKDLWFRVTRKYTLKGIPETLAKYRIHTDSLSFDYEKVYRCQMAVLQKHFGSDEGDTAHWPQEKRIAYGVGYRVNAYRSFRRDEQNRGWEFLSKAMNIYPELIYRIDTYYEYAFIQQPPGYAGQVDFLDLEDTENELTAFVVKLKEIGNLDSNSSLNIAYAKMYYTLAMLHDQAGDWSKARAYMVKAASSHSRLLLSTDFIRRFVKLSMGPGLAGTVRKFINHL